MHRSRARLLAFLTCAAVLVPVGLRAADGATASKPNASGTVATARVTVVRTYPHDPSMFTEGLEVRGDTVYESSGLYGLSSVRTSSLKTGATKATVALPTNFFAEGLALLPNGRMVQLTWRERTAIVRDTATLAEVSRVSFDEDGWGLCYSDAKKLLVHSDGTNLLRLRDPATFEVIVTIPTKYPDNRTPMNLNELECVGNTVYVNVWTTKTILQIDLTTGFVIRSIDASAIGPTATSSPDDVLNGIARLPNGNFLLTGKRWPRSYEVKFVNTPVKK